LTPAPAKDSPLVPTIYVLDDDRVYAKLLAAHLGSPGRVRARVFEQPEELLAHHAEEPADAVITDLVMPDLNGVEVTRRLRRSDPHLPIFVLTGHGDIATAIEALKAGATEYLTKPVNIDELMTLLNRALAARPLVEAGASLEQARGEQFSVKAILGEHPNVEAVRTFVRKMAAIPRPTVLLLGESGTGKNLVARAIHYSSPHSDGRFVEINCSALPASLLEAELFGYKKGAFTDAREAKRGLIEVADGGTLFLDEIAELGPELQAKLLNVLESRRFRRLGGTDEMDVALRLVTATNRNLDELVQSGRFRADLYYRVSVAAITLPALREIKSDIPRLADHFRELFAQEFKKKVDRIEPAALDVLAAWQWPGNVRELRNVIERAMIFTEGPLLKHSDLPPLNPRDGSRAEVAERAEFWLPKGRTLAEAEREYIRLTLEHTEGDIQRAAELLGISRKNLWEKRKKYGLLPNPPDAEAGS
jgi:DNA-binding NtrC family response regulator